MEQLFRNLSAEYGHPRLVTQVKFVYETAERRMLHIAVAKFRCGTDYRRDSGLTAVTNVEVIHRNWRSSFDAYHFIPERPPVVQR